ncbi:restriction endonuclease subunit S [Haemophilus haemolyticus]|uniref:restriction endonuclease subunit S n=1 Tax=Haemophilus haemolyticus TaxID=726 RepID=UPI000E58DC81|nr:restriction endonuclease subunit S [Haemophilus haemolyticus]
MSNQEFISASEFCDLVTDGTHDSPKKTETGIKLVTSKNIVGGSLDLTSAYFISELDARNINKRSQVHINDVLLSMIGTVGEVALIEKEPDFVIKNVGLLKNSDSKKARWLYYYLKSPIAQNLIKDRLRGTTQQYIPLGELRNLPILKPNSEEHLQNTIEQLSSLDKKIQLNTQINQTLEQIAQALFKSWFVDFDPVRAKVQALSDGLNLEQAELAAMQAISGKTPEELTALSQAQPDHYAELAETAKAFPCEMVEVDGVEVPKGWEVKRIDEIANIIKGKSYKSSELEKSKTALVTLKSFNRGGGYRLDGLKEYTGKYKPEQEVFAGELIIAYTDVTQAADVIGKPAMVMSDSNYQHLVISLDVGVVRPFNDVYKHFLYCLAMTESFQAHTKSFCTGTTVLHLGKDAVPSFEFINPSNELLHIFYKQTSPIFEKINLQIEENKNLEKARDLLLPRLLNGEIQL